MSRPRREPRWISRAVAVAIARNHPFADGNKRAAFQVMYVFLGLIGLRIAAEEAAVVDVMLRLAAGEGAENALAEWLVAHVEER